MFIYIIYIGIRDHFKNVEDIGNFLRIVKTKKFEESGLKSQKEEKPSYAVAYKPQHETLILNNIRKTSFFFLQYNLKYVPRNCYLKNANLFLNIFYSTNVINLLKEQFFFSSTCSTPEQLIPFSYLLKQNPAIVLLMFVVMSWSLVVGLIKTPAAKRTTAGPVSLVRTLSGRPY